MTTLIATIIVLGVLIFVHELGHFMAAKTVDIRVERFSIGLGPRLWGTTRGETEYVLSAIPLGGYVKMGGMEDEVMEKIEGGAEAGPRAPGPRDFDAKPVWQRAFVISAGVIMNFLFAFLAYTVVAAFWGSPELETRRLGSVRAEALPAGAAALADLPIGAEVTRVGTAEVEHWQDIGDALEQAPAGVLTVTTADPAAEVTITLGDDPEERTRIRQSLGFWLPAMVERVTRGTPAAEAGLRRGDVITRVDDQPIASWSELVEAISPNPGRELELEVQRSGEPLYRTVVPAPTEVGDPETGGTQTIGRIGLGQPLRSIDIHYERVPVSQAVSEGARSTVGTTVLIVTFLRDLFTGNVPLRSVGSIGAIAEMSGDAAQRGPAPFLDFMALFSINLAILNLLPIPVLDGGHLVFLLIEAVRGRALSIEQRVRWSQVGLVVLMGIMVLALSNDIRRWLGF